MKVKNSWSFGKKGCGMDYYRTFLSTEVKVGIVAKTNKSGWSSEAYLFRPFFNCKLFGCKPGRGIMLKFVFLVLYALNED